MYYSQQNEDKILFEKYLNYPNGFFIELGAMDGVMFSNTLFFEKELNWKGILIEPTIDIETLNRNRPNCFNYSCAISQKKEPVEFLGGGALGGIVSSMSDFHKFGWGLDKQNSFFVQSRPINEIIYDLKKDNEINKIDFFSLDVEGGELEVLKTYPFEIPTYVILIEMAGHDKEKDEKCREILKNNGFELSFPLGCNEVWINKKNK